MKDLLSDVNAELSELNREFIELILFLDRMHPTLSNKELEFLYLQRRALNRARHASIIYSKKDKKKELDESNRYWHS